MIKFQINARPQPKERPYSIGRGKRRTPDRTVNFELLVAMEFRNRFPLHKPLTGPLGLCVVAEYQRPRTVGKGYWHTGTGDLDNICKAISDGLNKVAWLDDRQVASLIAQKTWGKTDRIEVMIVPLE